jgi:hypothetical protein
VMVRFSRLFSAGLASAVMRGPPLGDECPGCEREAQAGAGEEH